MQWKVSIGGLLLIGALVCTAAFTTVVNPAGAQNDDPPVADIASVGLRSRRAVSGATVVPVEINVASLGRAIEGTLLIEARDVAINWEIGVQLAANTEATQSILVPVSPFGSLALDATLVSDGEEIAADDLNVEGGRDGATNAIGVIGLEASGPTIDLSPSVGDAAVFELANLDLLEGLDSVIVSPAGMRSLSESEQQVLLTWLSAGRQLIVADRAGSIDESLPEDWQGDTDIVNAGAGLLRYVGTEWEQAVPPGPNVASNPQVREASGITHNELKSDAGFKVPGIGIIASILGAYMILAGPVLFAVLAARNRQRLTWVLLPALAVVFTIGVVVTGSVLTRGRGNGHATIVEVSPIGAAITDTLLIAESGEQILSLPVGYSLTTSGLGSTGGQVGSPLILRPTPGADELVFEIDSGSGGTAIVRGQSTQFADAITISEVSTSPTEVGGVVSNTSGSDLFNVVAIIGNRVADIGTLSNGSSTPFNIDLAARARQPNPELRVWEVDNQFNLGAGFEGGGFGFGGGNSIDDGPLNGSAWVEWCTTRNRTSPPSGIITVVGWTRDIDASLLDGQGRTALVARSGLGAVDGPVPLEAVRTIAVRATDPFGFGFEFDGFGGELEEPIQYIRPPGSDTSNLSVQIENVVTSLEVWIDEDWRFFELPEQGRADIRIPAEAWKSDTLWIRASVAGGFFDPSSSPAALVVSDDGTEDVTLLPEGENFRRQGFEQNPGEFQVTLAEVLDAPLDEELMFVGEGEIFNSYDEWNLVLAAGDEVTVSMDAFNNGGLDPYLIIRDSNGRQIAENDDFNGLNSRVQFSADEDGVYVIETRPLSGGGAGGGYEVTIEVEAVDPAAPRPTITAAPPTTIAETTTIPVASVEETETTAVPG